MRFGGRCIICHREGSTRSRLTASCLQIAKLGTEREMAHPSLDSFLRSRRFRITLPLLATIIAFNVREAIIVSVGVTEVNPICSGSFS
jgi:hypothetical protein